MNELLLANQNPGGRAWEALKIPSCCAWFQSAPDHSCGHPRTSGDSVTSVRSSDHSCLSFLISK